MSGTGNLRTAIVSRTTNLRTLKNIIDSTLGDGSSMSISLSHATVAVSLDTRGDWTISVGLSLKSDHFHEMLSCLETLGFFQATETEGTSYLFWTSLLTDIENSRVATEQILARTMNILETGPASHYIS